MTDLRWLAACAGLLGLGAGLLWAGGMLAADDHFDVFDEDDLPDPAAYDAPPWMRWEWLIGS
jgi:hypothetical protein